ncbi:hypothetical protein L9F63_010487, partial [Diploptera punctata]
STRRSRCKSTSKASKYRNKTPLVKTFYKICSSNFSVSNFIDSLETTIISRYLATCSI